MKSLIFTIEENCYGCNKCMLSCPVADANISYLVDGKNKIHLDPDKCIMCGKCLEVCDHEARDYSDDTARFFADLAQGMEISIIAAPSLKTNYPGYRKIFGYLAAQGVREFYDVSFGADITTWAYIKHLESTSFSPVIAQPCPAVVSYIQKFEHLLVEKLIPVHSPMQSAAIYVKKYLGVTDRLCFISPCIAKAREIEDSNGYITYNVTFAKLMNYLAAAGVQLEVYPDHEFTLPAMGLGGIFSKPGGLRENIELYNKNLWVKQIEGVENVYPYLSEYSQRMQSGKSVPQVLDVLNCLNGCNVGSATCPMSEITDMDEIMHVQKVEQVQRKDDELKTMVRFFDEQLKLQDFTRSYRTEKLPALKEPTPDEYNEIFNTMHKTTEESRKIDCNSCGYRNCHHMAKAIFNSINHKENCLDYNIKMSSERKVLEEKNTEIMSLLEEVVRKSEEINAANEKLKEMDKIKSDFISTVSHELRTPLTSVLGFAKIIQKKLETVIFPEIKTTDRKVERTIGQLTENINIIVAEGERLTTLINDVLDIAKMESGKIEWKMEPIDMEQIIDRAVAAVESLIVEKGLRLVKEIDQDLPEINGDKDRLIQVVINLLSNAIKFTDLGSIICRVKLEASLIKVSVIDSGIGIAAEDLEKVFEKFKQVGDTLTDKPKGTGLGLPICREIIKHHDGRIWAESNGKGSTFSFTIPCIGSVKLNGPLVFQDAIVKQLKDRVGNVVPLINGIKRILVVDDEESIRSLLRQEFEEVGYIVEEAGDGVEAIQKIKFNKPDLITLDVMMPKMNGFDVAAVIKNDPATRSIPIIILSIVDAKERGFNVGVDRYLTKPINMNELLQEVKLLLSDGETRKKVLVVNDDEPTLNTLTGVLQAKGYSAVEVYKNQDSLDILQEEHLDMICMNANFLEHHNIMRALKFNRDLEEILIIVYKDAGIIAEQNGFRSLY